MIERRVVLFGLFQVLGGVWWGCFALWILPLVTFGGGLNCLRTALEHADAAEPPHRKYSFRSNPLERLPLSTNLASARSIR